MIMKKYLIVLLVAVLIAMVPLATYAAVENEPVASEGEVGGVVDAPLNETPAEGAETDEGWFYEAKEWVMINFSGIITVIVGVYAMFPKYGGIAALIRVVRNVSIALAALKKYIDDKNNPDSIYNVLDRMGGNLSDFLSDTAPVLDRLEQSIEKIENASLSQDKLCAALLAVVAGEELMAKEFSDLLSCSTTISQKHKAEFEEAYLAARAQLKAAVKEAIGDDKQSEKADS
jgi:hypothetical protein